MDTKNQKELENALRTIRDICLHTDDCAGCPFDCFCNKNFKNIPAAWNMTDF